MDISESQDIFKHFLRLIRDNHFQVFTESFENYQNELASYLKLLISYSCQQNRREFIEFLLKYYSNYSIRDTYDLIRSAAKNEDTVKYLCIYFREQT